DVILPSALAGKGVLLTQITLGWYEHFAGSLRTHFLTSELDQYPPPFARHAALAGRSMLVAKARRYDVECVVRGYLSGSGWREYGKSGRVCGVELPAGLLESAELPQPIFTPATKADGGHDENISFDEMCKFVPRPTAERLRDVSIDIYTRARDYARERGIILADTKFEFGSIDGEITLIDEMLTPDSSRFWPAAKYAPGRGQESFDKQFVRDYLDRTGWDHNPPAPELTPEVVERTVARYREAHDRLFPHRNLERYL
ncbi:MAG: phosphoribosylaminoimidazolesuccinocarboxamide synthase, partial [Candidatus Krumholzibacteria bacterium]|nr:phosphoribosylaminoimidazolesuccinocarboxamide synthase [Candidatus Krumholzibacteria bacterium]